jgi:hypothetical protein
MIGRAVPAGPRGGAPLFVHSRCEDELLAKAELLLFVEDAAEAYPGRPVVGSYDVEPGISIGDLKRAYRHDPESYQRLLQHRRRVLSTGWPYPPWTPGVEASAQ